ncbi:hypothetical protein, unlikely [Trypanosoma congolense IL3000]|uniref:Uncharacterized protein n=1 Tax=Trypanosoma congolense (strain IL3000) TaxID=1068625 RepID=F9WBC9_TRYCI|nr:hypothetical protein, unlikely [Trypanosoma congolense IL3000]
MVPFSILSNSLENAYEKSEHSTSGVSSIGGDTLFGMMLWKYADFLAPPNSGSRVNGISDGCISICGTRPPKSSTWRYRQCVEGRRCLHSFTSKERSSFLKQRHPPPMPWSTR